MTAGNLVAIDLADGARNKCSFWRSCSGLYDRGICACVVVFEQFCLLGACDSEWWLHLLLLAPCFLASSSWDSSCFTNAAKNSKMVSLLTAWSTSQRSPGGDHREVASLEASLWS